MIEFGADIPFVHHLGFELKLFDAGQSEIHFRPKAAHLNSFGVTHGGALMTLLDVTMAVAARSVAKEMGCVTIEMKTSFMHPSKANGILVAKGRLLHRTATMSFTEAGVYDDTDQLCAHATGTFKMMRRLATGARDVNDFQAASAGISTD